MEQLKLSSKQLKEIGFKPLKIKGDDLNKDRVIYKINCLNGYIYCNQGETLYRWYHKTILGELSNNVHLDIVNLQSLYIFLSYFKIDYKLIINK